MATQGQSQQHILYNRSTGTACSHNMLSYIQHKKNTRHERESYKIIFSITSTTNITILTCTFFSYLDLQYIWFDYFTAKFKGYVGTQAVPHQGFVFHWKLLSCTVQHMCTAQSGLRIRTKLRNCPWDVLSLKHSGHQLYPCEPLPVCSFSIKQCKMSCRYNKLIFTHARGQLPLL